MDGKVTNLAVQNLPLQSVETLTNLSSCDCSADGRQGNYKELYKYEN